MQTELIDSRFSHIFHGSICELSAKFVKIQSIRKGLWRLGVGGKKVDEKICQGSQDLTVFENLPQDCLSGGGGGGGGGCYACN